MYASFANHGGGTLTYGCAAGGRVGMRAPLCRKEVREHNFWEYGSESYPELLGNERGTQKGDLMLVKSVGDEQKLAEIFIVSIN
jgi:hypothetical protein